MAVRLEDPMVPSQSPCLLIKIYFDHSVSCIRLRTNIFNE